MMTTSKLRVMRRVATAIFVASVLVGTHTGVLGNDGPHGQYFATIWTCDFVSGGQLMPIGDGSGEQSPELTEWWSSNCADPYQDDCQSNYLAMDDDAQWACQNDCNMNWVLQNGNAQMGICAAHCECYQ
jgi:hypothetical protein